MLKGLGAFSKRKIEEVMQEIETKKQLSLKHNQDIQNLTQQLEIQKIRNKVFERQSRFARIITFCVVIFGIIHVLSYWHKHAKNISLTLHDSDQRVDDIID
jgi:uncharacterized membrane protein